VFRGLIPYTDNETHAKGQQQTNPDKAAGQAYLRPIEDACARVFLLYGVGCHIPSMSYVSVVDAVVYLHFMRSWHSEQAQTIL
jgi:hypothetical protein